MINYELEYNCLKPFEIDWLKSGRKTIVMVPTGVRYNRVIHLHGMSFLVKGKFSKAFCNFTNDEAKLYGVNFGTIHASCEHPEFRRPYYGNIISTEVNGWKDALRYYYENNDEHEIDMTTEYDFVLVEYCWINENIPDPIEYEESDYEGECQYDDCDCKNGDD